jgi:DNA-binding response OmpR family regulator
MLLDLRMPHISGEELLPKIISEYPEVPVIVVTGANDVETAVKCMQHGAFDYIVKPIEKSRLVAATKRGLQPNGQSKFANCSGKINCLKPMCCQINWIRLKHFQKSLPSMPACDPFFNTWRLLQPARGRC